MTETSKSSAARVTPVKTVIAILSVVVVVALASDDSDASYQPCNCCSCSGFPFPGWPTIPPYYPPTTPAPNTTPSTASPSQVSVQLTKVGSPIWKTTDFQLFTAPASPFPTEFFATLDKLLPWEGPGAATYTPHAPPYATELSANAAAHGLTSKSVFNESDITLSPNGVYFVLMMLPDPGVVGSSRDFAPAR
jgi:hypothetical protein